MDGSQPHNPNRAKLKGVAQLPPTVAPAAAVDLSAYPNSMHAQFEKTNFPLNFFYEGDNTRAAYVKDFTGTFLTELDKLYATKAPNASTAPQTVGETVKSLQTAMDRTVDTFLARSNGQKEIENFGLPYITISENDRGAPRKSSITGDPNTYPSDDSLYIKSGKVNVLGIADSKLVGEDRLKSLFAGPNIQNPINVRLGFDTNRPISHAQFDLFSFGGGVKNLSTTTPVGAANFRPLDSGIKGAPALDIGPYLSGAMPVTPPPPQANSPGFFKSFRQFMPH